MTTTETPKATIGGPTTAEPFLQELGVGATDGTSGTAAPDVPCDLKFSLAQNALLKALLLIMKTTAPRATLPVLGHVLLVTRPGGGESGPAQVILTATNLETGISLRVDAQVEREGAYSIPAKALLDCVKTFPKGGAVTIEVEAPRVLVSCGKRRFALKGGLGASEFPLLWQKLEMAEGSPCVVESGALRRAIKEVQFAAADDDSRPILMTICMHMKEDLIELITANPFRLAFGTIALTQKTKGRDAIILPPVTSMRLLAEVIPSDVLVTVIWDEKKERAVFQAGPLQFITRLVAGTYPDYTALISKPDTTTFTLERKQLEQILQAFKPFALEDSNRFRLSYTSSGVVAFHAESGDLGEADDELEARVEGKDGQVSFNVQLLLDVLKSVQVEAFTFCLQGWNKPGVIVPTGRDDFRYVLQPIGPRP